MFIKKIEIESFKKLKNFNLDFSQTDKLDNNKNMKMTIMIGENGTAKTTIFEALISKFLHKEISPEEECKIEYIYNNKLYNSGMQEAPIPNRIIVSTYTPIDKLDQVTEQMENREILYKTSVSRINLQYVLTRILKHYGRNDGKEMDTIFEYVGYGNHKLFLEISDYKLKVVSRMVWRAIHKLYEHYEKISYLFKDKYIGRDFESIITGYQQELDLFKNNIESEIGDRINYKLDIRKGLTLRFPALNIEQNNLEKQIINICAVEILFVIYKMRVFLKLSEVTVTSDKEKAQKFLSMDKIRFYPGGAEVFRKDITLLEACSTSFWKDLWFDKENDRIPLSMLSSGELSMFLRVFDLYDYVEDNSLVLIDEPETHLHPKWIKGYIELLNKLLGNKRCHVIIATHSPLIVSDVPQNCILVLKNNGEKIEQVKVTEKTLGLNYDEILSEVFGLNDDKGKMINEYAKLLEKELENGNFKKALEIYSQMADSNVKYDLYPKLKAYKEQKGKRDV